MNGGKSYVQEVPKAELARYVADGTATGMESSAIPAGWTGDRFSAATDYGALAGADVAIVQLVVDTPNATGSQKAGKTRVARL